MVEIRHLYRSSIVAAPEIVEIAPPSRVVIGMFCNNLGLWPNQGVWAAIANKWKKVRDSFVAWSRERMRVASQVPLGEVQFVSVSPSIVVANMVVRVGFRRLGAQAIRDVNPVIDYDSLGEAFRAVATKAREIGASSIHLPYLESEWAGIFDDMLAAEMVDFSGPVLIHHLGDA